MNLVFFHYHLNRGGVTRVIESHLRALAKLPPNTGPTSVIVAYGGRSTDWDPRIVLQLPFDLEMVDVPSLDYDDVRPNNEQDLYSVLSQMLDARALEMDSTVLHAHNHSLGKNAAFPSALCKLAQDGWHTLLQIHDFAEDLRPQNYMHLVDTLGSLDGLHAILYPQADHIHYATLNRRDFNMLSSAGIATDRLHRLPNPVFSVRADRASEDSIESTLVARRKLASNWDVPLERPYILYPVRGIQRKNLGELLLWASLCDNATFAITLPPLNAKELKLYNVWKSIAKSLSLPILFEVGSELSLSENYAAADAVITTSVAEGFGLVFLEAATMGRPLIGRNLPGITDDFLEAGMQFPGLANSMKIPKSCIDISKTRQTYLDNARQLQNAYQLPPVDEDRFTAALGPILAGDTIDFGRLDSLQQQHVLRQVRKQPELRDAINALNPATAFVHALAHTDGGKAMIAEHRRCTAANRRVIENHYSLDVIGNRLQSIYEGLLQRATGSVETRPAVARQLQQAFLMPSQLFPLRLER